MKKEDQKNKPRIKKTFWVVLWPENKYSPMICSSYSTAKATASPRCTIQKITIDAEEGENL